MFSHARAAVLLLINHSNCEVIERDYSMLVEMPMRQEVVMAAMIRQRIMQLLPSSSCLCLAV